MRKSKIFIALAIACMMALALVACPQTETKYSVTFEMNGGIAIERLEVESGKTLGDYAEKINPTKTGYTFAGWTTDEAGEVEFKDTDKIEKDLTLYAQWEAVPLPKVTVTFMNGEDVIGTPTEIDMGGKIEAIEAPTAPEGMVFAGWYNGETLFDFDTEIEENITLTAKWEAAPLPKVTVTFMNGEDVIGTPTEIDMGGKIDAIEAPTAPEGMVFAGWYNGETLFDFDTEIEDNLTLTAKWEAVKVEEIDKTALYQLIAAMDDNMTITFDFRALLMGAETTLASQIAEEGETLEYIRISLFSLENPSFMTEQKMSSQEIDEEGNVICTITREYIVYLCNGLGYTTDIIATDYADEAIEDEIETIRKVTTALDVAAEFAMVNGYLQQALAYAGEVDWDAVYNGFTSFVDYAETEDGYEYSYKLELKDIVNMLIYKIKSITEETTVADFVFDLYNTFARPGVPFTTEAAKAILMEAKDLRISDILGFAAEMSGYSVQELSGMLMKAIMEYAPEYMELIGPMIQMDPTIEGLILTIMKAPLGVTIEMFIDMALEYRAVEALNFLYNEFIGIEDENFDILALLQTIPTFDEISAGSYITVNETKDGFTFRQEANVTITGMSPIVDVFGEITISKIGKTVSTYDITAEHDRFNNIYTDYEGMVIAFGFDLLGKVADIDQTAIESATEGAELSEEQSAEILKLMNINYNKGEFDAYVSFYNTIAIREILAQAGVDAFDFVMRDAYGVEVFRFTIEVPASPAPVE